MDHAEDAQPNESVRGRPKRLLPFVKNTSRGRGQGRGRGSGINPGAGRGQGTIFAPGVSRAGPSQSSMAPSSSYHTLPSKPQLAWTPKSESVGVTSGTIPTAAPADALVPDRLATQPQRRKFRPIMRDRPQVGKSFAPGTGAPKHPLNEQLDSNANTLLCAADPPAKRQRVDETLATTSTSLTSAPEINAVKLEEPTEPLLVPSRDQATSGTEFISYDKYPKCLSSCGIPAKQLLNNRLSIKGMRVRALQKRGLIVGAVFVRDDGIAIDWSLPPGSKVNGPIPSTETPVPQPGTPVDSSLALPSQRPGTPPLSSESPPPHLDPSSTSAHAPPDQHPATPTSTEVAYREIIIPPRCLPLRGDTRKLEIWVVEQMHLLEAELGPGLDLQPELLGIGEYLTGQRVPDDATSRVRIRYERPTRIVSDGRRDTAQSKATGRDAASVAHHTDQPQASSNPASPSHPTGASPPIAYLPQSPSPVPRDPTPFIIKPEQDELALDPPSPCPPPSTLPEVPPTEGTGSPPSLSLGRSTQSSLNGNALDERTVLPGGGSSYSGPVPTTTTEMEELQRLRRDLEASRLEAERKHRDFEQRILELSRKNTEAGTPQAETSSVIVPEASTDSQVRIADESESKLFVLRRGKHDKTRRLLAPSPSMVLHVSWLGVLQLVDQNTRQIVATGFEEGAPDAVSVEDACLLSESSVAIAFAGDACQLGVATLGEKNFKYLSLSDQPHEAKGICAVVPINSSEVVTLGYNHSYAHWRFDPDTYSTTPLPIPKFHQCTALAYEPLAGNIITAGSDSGKRSKLGVYSLLDSQRIPVTVDLSNHVHHIHTDADNPSLLILELARLDDQFQVHDMRLPLYQSVQKFGYQAIVHEKGAFRTRGSMKGHFFSRGDVGIVRAWDRRNFSSYQTLSVIPHQKVVDVILTGGSLICATESHQVMSYPTV